MMGSAVRTFDLRCRAGRVVGSEPPHDGPRAAECRADASVAGVSGEDRWLRIVPERGNRWVVPESPYRGNNECNGLTGSRRTFALERSSSTPTSSTSCRADDVGRSDRRMEPCPRRSESAREEYPWPWTRRPLDDSNAIVRRDRPWYGASPSRAGAIRYDLGRICQRKRIVPGGGVELRPSVIARPFLLHTDGMGSNGSFSLPAGTVTFLLTDIEGSTSGWEDDPDAMARAVARHYAVLDEVISARGGVRPLEQGEGDSVVAAFAQGRGGVGGGVRGAGQAARGGSRAACPDGVALGRRPAPRRWQLRRSNDHAVCAVARLRPRRPGPCLGRHRSSGCRFAAVGCLVGGSRVGAPARPVASGAGVAVAAPVVAISVPAAALAGRSGAQPADPAVVVRRADVGVGHRGRASSVSIGWSR